MQRNVTIRIDGDLLRWARVKAAEADTSVSKFVGEMLERERKRSSGYWLAYARWKEAMESAPPATPEPGYRFNREETHDRALHRRLTQQQHDRT